MQRRKKSRIKTRKLNKIIKIINKKMKKLINKKTWSLERERGLDTVLSWINKTEIRSKRNKAKRN